MTLRSTRRPLLSTIVTLRRWIAATSPSSRIWKRRVTGSSAEMSEATKFSSVPSPTSSGQPARASTIVSASCSLMTASA